MGIVLIVAAIVIGVCVYVLKRKSVTHDNYPLTEEEKMARARSESNLVDGTENVKLEMVNPVKVM